MSPKKAPAPPDGKWSWSKVLAGIVVFVGLFGLLDGPWVGIFVGSIFVLLGLLIAMTFFGPYDRGPAAIFQAPGRLLLGALMIFLGGLALVSAISDIRPSCRTAGRGLTPSRPASVGARAGPAEARAPRTPGA